jgi:adenylate kinase
MNVTILGAPGAGKGTLIKELISKLGVPTISASDSLRSAVRSSGGNSFFPSQDILVLKECMSSGKLVPDETVVKVMASRLSQDDCKNGYILDGFPRTVPQARFMDENNIKLDLAIELRTDRKIIENRMLGRRVCPKCNEIYNLITDKKPKIDGKCDKCGANLIIRNDDTPEIVKNRLDVYDRETYPVVDYYKKKGILISVDGSKSLADMVSAVLESVGS